MLIRWKFRNLCHEQEFVTFFSSQNILYIRDSNGNVLGKCTEEKVKYEGHIVEFITKVTITAEVPRHLINIWQIHGVEVC